MWEEERNEPIRTFQWGVDSLHDICFNPIETHLLGMCYEMITVCVLNVERNFMFIHK